VKSVEVSLFILLVYGFRFISLTLYYWFKNDLEGSVAGVTAHFTRILAKMKSEMELNDAKHEIELSSVKHELELSCAQHQIELAAAKHEVALSVAKHEMEIAALRREMEIAAAKRKMELAIAKHDMLQFSSSAVDEVCCVVCLSCTLPGYSFTCLRWIPILHHHILGIDHPKWCKQRFSSFWLRDPSQVF
jgi:predicted amino acid-binding ACT domain protein